MFRKYTLIIAALGAGVLGVGYLVLISGLIPANADSEPSALEQWVAQTSLSAAIKRSAPSGPNPVKMSNKSLLAGVALYKKNCAVCHGTSEGAASETPIARGQYIRPPQLAADGVEDDPMPLTFWVVKHGIRWTAMPAWGGALSDREIWTLALFLKNMDNLPPSVEKKWKLAKTN